MRNFVFMGIALLIVGCASTMPFGSIPKTLDEFGAQKEVLVEQYPEIAQYEKSFRGLTPNTPYADVLVSQWGEPDVIRKDWSYIGMMGAVLTGAAAFDPVSALVAGGIVLVVKPSVPERYYWNKGKYCIEAYIDQTWEHTFKKRVFYWKWHELTSADLLPDKCKKTSRTTTADAE